MTRQNINLGRRPPSPLLVSSPEPSGTLPPSRTWRSQLRAWGQQAAVGGRAVAAFAALLLVFAVPFLLVSLLFGGERDEL